jgi:hypothetical protein
MEGKPLELPPKSEVTYTFVRLFATSSLPTMNTLAAKSMGWNGSLI